MHIHGKMRDRRALSRDLCTWTRDELIEALAEVALEEGSLAAGTLSAGEVLAEFVRETGAEADHAELVRAAVACVEYQRYSGTGTNSLDRYGVYPVTRKQEETT